MEINIQIDKEYKSGIKAARLKNIIRQVQKAEKVSEKSEIGLVITGDEEIHKLNLKYLDEDRPTDVLSFPMNEQLEDRAGVCQSPGWETASRGYCYFVSNRAQTGPAITSTR